MSRMLAALQQLAARPDLLPTAAVKPLSAEETAYLARLRGAHPILTESAPPIDTLSVEETASPAVEDTLWRIEQLLEQAQRTVDQTQQLAEKTYQAQTTRIEEQASSTPSPKTLPASPWANTGIPAANYRPLETSAPILQWRNRLLAALGTKPKSLAIVNVEPNGDSAGAAVELAKSLVGPTPVLLIDAHPRVASIAGKLKIGEQRGWTDALSGDLPWHAAVVRTPWEGLLFLPRGQNVWPQNENMLAPMLEMLRSPMGSVLLAAGAAAEEPIWPLASACGGVCLGAQLGTTPRQEVAKVLASLRQVDAAILGLCLYGV